MGILRNASRAMLALLLALAVNLSATGSVAAASRSPHSTRTSGARVIVVVRPSISQNIVTCEVAALNARDASAKDVVITVPFDAARFMLQDNQLSDSSALVDTSHAGELMITLAKLPGRGDMFTDDIHFAMQPNASAGMLCQQASYTWGDDATGGSGASNIPVAGAGPVYSLNVSASGGMDNFSTAIFAPDEPVTVWYSMPDGSTVATKIRHQEIVDETTADSTKDKNEQFSKDAGADSTGAVSLNLGTGKLPMGTYTMVLHGNWTGFSAIGTFQVQ